MLRRSVSERRIAASIAARLACACGLAFVVACAAPRAPETATSLPDAGRRPDGVVVEPKPATPDAVERADVRSAVVALREPLARDAVERTARAMFRAFEREDAEGLVTLLYDPARAVVLDAPRGQRATLRESWLSRLRERDYKRLAQSRDVARFDAIKVTTFDEAGDARPPEMKPGDVLARVPVEATHAGSEELFGDVVVLLLRRAGDEYKIVGFAEEDAP